MSYIMLLPSCPGFILFSAWFSIAPAWLLLALHACMEGTSALFKRVMLMWHLGFTGFIPSCAPWICEVLQNKLDMESKIELQRSGCMSQYGSTEDSESQV